MTKCEKHRTEGKKMIKIKTLRHSDFMEVGKDYFDENVSKFLNEIGEESIINYTAINYEHIDIKTQQTVTDYGLLVVYRADS